jgi:hypothetical protein
MVMKLKNVLLERESHIRKKWLNAILDMYPADTKKFLVKTHDPFANPVGQTLEKETENLFRELVHREDPDPERISPILDRIIRIRAIQDFSPSQSILFLFALKGVIEKELAGEIKEKDLLEDLLEFESKIDRAVLMAFDIYMNCRETLYHISANQAKNQVSYLLRKTGLVSELPEWDPGKQRENST